MNELTPEEIAARIRDQQIERHAAMIRLIILVVSLVALAAFVPVG